MIKNKFLLLVLLISLGFYLGFGQWAGAALIVEEENFDLPLTASTPASAPESGANKNSALPDSAESTQQTQQIPPEIQIVAPGAGQTMTGRVLLSAKSKNPAVNRVDFSLPQIDESTFIGAATFDTSENNWNYIWDTALTTNGLYNLKAEAKGLAGTLASSIITIEIENNDDTPSALAATAEPVQLSLNAPPAQSILSGDIYLIAKSNVGLATLDFILNDSSNKMVFTGGGKLSPGDSTGLTWTYGLKTASFNNGDYSLYLQTNQSGKVFKSSPSVFTIKNELQVNLSKIIVSLPSQASAISGLANLEAQSDQKADKVEFRLTSTLAKGDPLYKVYLKSAPVEADQGMKLNNARVESVSKDSLKWTASFKTDLYEDGVYNLSAVAYKNAQVFESPGITITIRNDSADAISLSRSDIEKLAPIKLPTNFILLPSSNSRVQGGPVAILIDRDSDGLTDSQEIRFGLDSYKIDTDNDTFSDGVEVKGGYNPLGLGKKVMELSAIDKVILNKTPIEFPQGVQSGQKNDTGLSIRTLKADAAHFLILDGQAKPSTIVTIYILGSIPLVDAVSVSSTGDWHYLLSEVALDGTHQAYVAYNDESGKITALSQPVSFTVKGSELIESSINLATASLSEISMPPSQSSLGLGNWRSWVAQGAVAVLIVVVVLIHFFKKLI